MTPVSSPTRLRVAATAAVALVVTGLAAACTTEGGDAEPTRSPSVAPPAPSPSATLDGAQADLDQLPLSREGITEWAAGALPPRTGDGVVANQSGWLGEGTSTQLTVSAPDEPAGAYAVDVACLGAGTITVRLDEPDDAASPGDPDATCSDETVSVEYDSSPDAPQVTLGLVGDPTAYAVRIAPVMDGAG